jgi:hypothetical protein
MRCRSIITAGFSVALLATSLSSAAPDPSVTVSNGIETRRIGDRVIESDMTGKGAVLCTLAILEAVKVAAGQCFQGQDPDLQTELDDSLKRIDEFVIRNSVPPTTQANLDARSAEGRKQLEASGKICTGDAAKLYGAFRRRGAVALRATTTDLLSIPREPVINPCL